MSMDCGFPDVIEKRFSEPSWNLLHYLLMRQSFCKVLRIDFLIDICKCLSHDYLVLRNA